MSPEGCSRWSLMWILLFGAAALFSTGKANQAGQVEQRKHFLSIFEFRALRVSFVSNTSVLTRLASRVLAVTMALGVQPIRFLKLQLRTTARAPECCFLFLRLCWVSHTLPQVAS